MKRLTKRQLRIIIAVNFLLITVMGVAIFFLVQESAKLPIYPPDDRPPITEHTRRRTAEISLNPFLSWELELVGEAQSVFSYIREQTNTLFIFGNSFRAGYDFDSTGVFVVAMDVYGVTREGGFWSFGMPEDRLRYVSVAEGGFVLAVEGTLPYLLHIDFEGEVIRRVDGFLNSFESIHSIRHIMGEGFLMFTVPHNTLTGVRGLRAIFFDAQLNSRGSSLATSVYSLELVKIFGGRGGTATVFVNASSGARNMPSVVQFNLGASTNVRVFEEFNGRLLGVSIHNGEFLLMVGINGSSLLRLRANFEVVGSLTQLSTQAPLFFDMLDVDGHHYLALFENSGAILNSNLVNMGVVPRMLVSDMQFVSNAVIFAGVTRPPLAENDMVTVNIFDDGQLIMSAPIMAGGNAKLALSRRHLICVFNIGNRVVVSALRYPLFL